MRYRHFSEMPVWKRAHGMILRVYELTGDFPDSERYGLISQMRRAAVSVTSNIAEGFGRRTSKDKARFYTFARATRFKARATSRVT